MPAPCLEPFRGVLQFFPLSRLKIGCATRVTATLLLWYVYRGWDHAGITVVRRGQRSLWGPACSEFVSFGRLQRYRVHASIHGSTWLSPYLAT